MRKFFRGDTAEHIVFLHVLAFVLLLILIAIFLVKKQGPVDTRIKQVGPQTNLKGTIGTFPTPEPTANARSR